MIFGLGANLGDPVAQLARAVDRLREVIEVERVSGVYRTDPVGFADQPDFYNLVVLGRSDAAPRALLDEAVRIERELGRVRTFPNAPRIIDIDLLARGDDHEESPEVIVPHPRLHQRAFVLVPLQEIAPDWLHPSLGLNPAQMLAALPEPGRIERVGELF